MLSNLITAEKAWFGIRNLSRTLIDRVYPCHLCNEV